MAIANQLMNPELVRGLKTIIFDCDGVLIDSYDANMRYYGSLLESMELEPLSPADKVFVHTRSHKEAIEHIIPANRLDEAWERINGFDSSILLPYLKRSEGVREFLEWLRSAGYGLAINTSRGDSIAFILSNMDLEGFFQPIMSSDVVSMPKPHPEGVHVVMREHGVMPHEVAFIGDSRVDMVTAQAAGVRFWAYKDISMEAEVHIESFWDIRAAMMRA